MLLPLNTALISQAIVCHLAFKYEIPEESISDVVCDIENIVSGEWKTKLLGENPSLVISFNLNSIPTLEIISSPEYLYRISESFIVSKLGIKRESFTIEEAFVPQLNEFWSDDTLIVINFYLNKDEE